MRIDKLAKGTWIFIIKRIRLLLVVLCFVSVCGCATVPPAVSPPSVPVPPKGVEGKYHRMEKGQTLWKISKIYNVDLDELIALNHISDVTNIDTGQLIFVPKPKAPLLAIPAVKASFEDFIWPVRGRVVNGFGQTVNNMVNKGLNIAVYSNSDVVASRKGKVVFYSPQFRGYGKTLIIDHRDGFYTVYARNKEVLVKPGDDVHQGASIAKLDGTSRDRDSYLHFQIRKGHTPQNPNFYLN